MPISFLTKEFEEELTTHDLDEMRQICQMSVFKKLIDIRIRRLFKAMTKESFELATGMMDELAAFAGQFEEADEKFQERKRREKQEVEMAVPNPFPDFDVDPSAGEIPVDT